MRLILLALLLLGCRNEVSRNTTWSEPVRERESCWTYGYCYSCLCAGGCKFCFSPTCSGERDVDAQYASVTAKYDDGTQGSWTERAIVAAGECER